MPELPDVETFRLYFEKTSLNKYIQTIHAGHSRVMKSSVSGLQRSLEGHSFDFIKRRGKYLFAKIKSDGFLLMHFGMTGFLKYYRNEEKKPDHIEFLVDFSNGFHLAYISKRKFGKLDLIEDIDEYCKKNSIGTDALELDKDRFISLLSGKKGKLKTTLMDQALISGLGNIYVDEILYQCGLHPEKSTADLSGKQQEMLFKNMKAILNTAIRIKADPDQLPGSYLIPHRKEGEKCPECDGRIKKIKVNNRGTYFCPECQQK